MKEMNPDMIARAVLLFLAGLSSGISLYELVIKWYTRSSYISRCQLCQWCRRKKEGRPAKDGNGN